MLLPAITFPFTTWNKTKQPPLPKAPGFTSRYPFLFPFLCHVSLQLRGECGFPLKFPCCLALCWLSPIVVYHQRIWQAHSWCLHCSHCWLEAKKGLIEPSPSTSLLTCSYSPHSHRVFWRGSLLQFWLLHPKNWGERHPVSALWDYSPATQLCVHTPYHACLCTPSLGSDKKIFSSFDSACRTDTRSSSFSVLLTIDLEFLQRLGAAAVWWRARGERGTLKSDRWICSLNLL